MGIRLKPTTQHRSSSSLLKDAHLILGVIVVAWMTAGLFSYVIPYVPSVVRYGIYGVWLGLGLLDSRVYLQRLLVQTLPLVFLLLYLSVLSVFVEQPYVAVHRSAFIYLFILYSIFLFYCEPERFRARKLIFGFMCVEIVYVATNTFFALRADPAIARLLAIGAEDAVNYTSIASLKGLGGYAFVYGLIPVILFLAHQPLKGPMRSLLKWGAVVGLGIVVLQASYTLAILLLGAYLAILLLYRVSGKRRALLVGVAVVGALVLIVSRPAVANGLVYLSRTPYASEVVSIRLLELADFLTRGLHGSADLATRIDLYSSSWSIFLDNPLFGLSASPLSSAGGGGHSAWIDMLAYFGLFAFALLAFFTKAYSFTKSLLPTSYVGLYNLCWGYFISLGLVNTLFFGSIFAVWFVFIPFGIDVLSRNSRLNPAEDEVDRTRGSSQLMV